MQQPEIRKKRNKTADEALAALMRLCARAEKSSGDALRLMRTWGVEPREQQRVLERLVEQRFIDDERFAGAFVREKLRLSGWGAYKIRTALQRKGIGRDTIDRALANATDGTAMKERLRALLVRKMRTTRSATPYDLRNKLMRYGMASGYEFETVADTVAELIKETDTCDDIF